MNCFSHLRTFRNRRYLYRCPSCYRTDSIRSLKETPCSDPTSENHSLTSSSLDPPPDSWQNRHFPFTPFSNASTVKTRTTWHFIDSRHNYVSQWLSGYVICAWLVFDVFSDCWQCEVWEICNLSGMPSCWLYLGSWLQGRHDFSLVALVYLPSYLLYDICAVSLLDMTCLRNAELWFLSPFSQ